MSYIWEDYRAEKIFRTGKKISPYMETAENNHVLCEVNPLIRFSEIFSDSGVLSENEELANMIFHYLAMTDMLSGINESQIKVNWLEKEILKGSFGEKLKDNWEECDFRYNVSTDPDDWHDAVYRRYGDLPDGRHFGVYIWPKSEAFSPASVMMIVDKSGEMRTNTVIKESWSTQDSVFWPMAAAASPSGKSIVWLKDGRIWIWSEDKREKRFLPDGGDDLTDRIEGIPVYDALMRDDGILVLFQEGKVYAYLCDEDIVLVRNADEGCWIPASKAESPCRNAGFPDINRLDDWPDEFAVMIRKEDDEGDYYSCGIRRVCFEPGLEIIKPEILADNPDLESVTIPASVKEVRTWAFGCCTNLKNLVIEGDLSRVANWAPDAFDACACEEQYLRLRNTDR